MKQKILAAAVLSVLASAAFAQSNVAVYGSIDNGLRNVTNVNAASESKLTMGSNGTFRSNRLGFKGTEDLGNGMSANYILELGFNAGTGALNNTTNSIFQREAHVGLSSNFGDIDFGRQYTVAYKTILAFDPFVYRYPSVTYALSSTAGTRYSNDIQYTKRMGELTVRAEYALGEVEGNTSAGTTKAVGGTYNNGPVKLGASYTTASQNVGTTAAPAYKDYTHYAVGGAYKFGDVTASVGYVNEKQATTALDETSVWKWAGLSYELQPQLNLTGAWYRVDAFRNKATAALGAGDGTKDLYMVGLTYEMSKRTTLYGAIDSTKLAGANATGGTTKLNQTTQTGISVGMMHMF